MTWMSIANWYFEFGDTRVIMDGYVTRVPGPPFFVRSPQFPQDMFATTTGPYGVDVDSVTRVWNALAPNGKVKAIFAGHSHFDHTWDVPLWSKLTNAIIIGGYPRAIRRLRRAFRRPSARTCRAGKRSGSRTA